MMSRVRFDMETTKRERKLSALEIIAARNSRRGSNTSNEASQKKLGTLRGVFVPTLQNILGIILYLRVPFIVGQAGILEALLIIWLSSMSTMLTSISMSAVATNGQPKAGGVYTMIKSSLGAELGGVTGVLLVLSNVFGTSMYVLGCIEVLQVWMPAIFGDINERLLGTAVLVGLALVVFVGISSISKFAILFLSGVLLSILSIWSGVIYHATHAGDGQNEHAGVSGFSRKNLQTNFGSRYDAAWSFARCLSIFYPAVTDPLAGSNLSGDLEDPQRSIPTGTITAVCTTILIFTLQVVLVSGASGRRQDLKADIGGRFVAAVAWPYSQLIYCGMLVSTLGAGLQSLAGAPRLLAAIGSDKLLPVLARFAPPVTKSFITGQQITHEPRKALLFCAFLSLCCIQLGNLDLVAPWITLWFLTTYVIINAACAHLSYDQAPSFRPTFRYFNWKLSILGVMLCLFLMMYINAISACGALAMALIIYKYIERQPAARGMTTQGASELLEFEVSRQYAMTDSNTGSPTASTRVHNGNTSIRPLSPSTSELLKETERKVAALSLESQADWRAGMRFKQARTAMLALEENDLQFKYWRPFILFFCKLENADGKCVPQNGMINLISQLMKRGKGLALVNGVLVSDDAASSSISPFASDRAERARHNLRKILRDRQVEGFADVVIAPSIIEGQRLLLQAKGLGFFRPNSVAIVWPDAKDRTQEDENGFYSILEDANVIGKTVLITKTTVEFPDSTAEPLPKSATVDVWWCFDLNPANGLLLLLPWLIMQSRIWKSAKLRLIVVSDNIDDTKTLDASLRKMLRAGGVIADLILLEVRLEDAPRFMHTVTKKRSPPNSPVPHAQTDDEIVSQGDDDEEDFHDIENGTKGLLPLNWSRTAHPSKLTTLIEQHSSDAELVVISLPDRDPAQSIQNWFQSVDTLVAPLKRAMLIKETGKEKVQFFQ